MVILKIHNWEDFHCIVLGTLKYILTYLINFNKITKK